MQTLIQNYLIALQTADYEMIVSLFTENAVVLSPLYGEQLACNFYKTLFDDTQKSELTLKEIFVNNEQNKAAFLFTYRWTMADGAVTTFDCIDVIEVNDIGKIIKLQIIYDTAVTRALHETLKMNQ